MDRKKTLFLALYLLSASAAHATTPPEEVATMGSGANIPADLIPSEHSAADTSVAPDLPKATPRASETRSQGVPPLKGSKSARDVMPVRDAGGRVIFPKGSSPTIVCAPLRVCDIQLQPGERVQGAPHIGDSVRWKISPAVSGSGAQAVTHLIVKPTEPGLDTNLIVPTTHGTYYLRLMSSAVHYVSSVAFETSEDQETVWRNLRGATASTDSAEVDSDMPIVAVNRLNFNYKIRTVKGKPSFKPLRAMDDGYHTYIAMNEELPQGDAPALIGISASGEEQMVNYRLKGNLFIVDGRMDKLALISGTGKHQERVELTRSPCRQRGWLGICWDPKE